MSAEARPVGTRAFDERRQADLLETIHEAVVAFDDEGRVDHANAATARLVGRPADTLPGAMVSDWFRVLDTSADWSLVFAQARRQGRWSGDLGFTLLDGSEGTCDVTIVARHDGNGAAIAGFTMVARDTTERRLLERQLIQAQKFEAIGQLAAGVAHEINTPAQYVADNLRFLHDVFDQVIGASRRWRAGEPPAGDEPDLDWIAREVPTAIRQSLEGMARIAEIVRGVRTFGHPGGGQRSPIDLNAAIEATVAVSRNEWKYVAELVTDLDPALPDVSAYPGELHHVFLNVLVNAAQALEEKRRGAGRGHIVITSRRDGEWAEVRIQDDGPGIPPAAQARVFDPFFTTKPVGKGTGQGLAICHRLVVDRHQGSITFETSPDSGTTFVIRLPLAPSSIVREAA